jgi:hypothetical protein
VRLTNLTAIRSAIRSPGATSTKVVMTSAVKTSPMLSAATSAIVIESSIVIRRSRILVHAS